MTISRNLSKLADTINTTGTVLATGGGTGLIAAGTIGNVLTSDGTVWVSSAGGGGGATWTSKTANYTAVAGDNILANTSAGSFTITLPASPTTGQTVQIVDAVGTFNLNPIRVARNGKLIMGLSEDLYSNTNGAGFSLLYNGTEWRII